MKEILEKEDSNGWTYYVNWGFAWLPMYCQGTFLWLRRYWVTWPEKADGSLVYAADVVSDWFKNTPNGNNPEMYRTYYPYDPRDKAAQAEFLRDNQ